MDKYLRGQAIAWGARLTLLALIGLALVGLLYPQFRPTEIQIGADQFSHALIIYGISLLAALSLPRLNLWLIAAILMTGAGAVELAQLWGLLDGAAQMGDFLADAAGVAAALLPIAVLRGRRVAKAYAR